VDIKIVCCDIDGTLVRDDKSLSEANKFWINRLVKEKGVKFVLVSGRMLTAMKYFYSKLDIKGPVSCYNGCSFYNDDYELIYEHRLSKDISKRILSIGRKVGIELIFFDDTKWIIEEKDSYSFNQKIKLYFCEPIISKFEDFLKTKDSNKILAMDPNHSKIEQFEKELRKEGIDEKLVTFYPSNNFFEVMPKGFDKGSAIDDLSRYYEIEKSQIMAIGDDYNDIGMLKKAGLSVGMKNSVPPVLEIVDYITDSNMEDGVATAIQKYFF